MINWTQRQWDVFLSIYEKIPRQGPGDSKSTIRALKSFKELNKNVKILDVGCGSVSALIITEYYRLVKTTQLN